MNAPIAMKRKRDGLAMPYSKTIVAAHPGEYVELAWNGKEWTEGRPLVAPPSPPPPATTKVSPLDGVKKPVSERVQIEPDTALAPTKKAAKAKTAKAAEAQA